MNQSINHSINQSIHIYIAPHIASESGAHKLTLLLVVSTVMPMIINSCQ